MASSRWSLQTTYTASQHSFFPDVELGTGRTGCDRYEEERTPITKRNHRRLRNATPPVAERNPIRSGDALRRPGVHYGPPRFSALPFSNSHINGL